jgi:hypothetical protein
MRRSLFLVAMVALVVALAVPAVAQEPAAATCCTNQLTGQIVPKLVRDCGQLGAGWVESAGPCVPGETEPGWWDAVLSWADGQVIYNPGGVELAKILGILASFVAIVQAVKKFIESSGKWKWLLGLIPGWAKIAAALSSTWVPMVLNALITGGVMLTAALQSPGLTLGEVLRIVIAIVGTDLLYRLIRDWLPIFPKGAPAK